ncbi:TadE/TadG family type IV pilus assembly protein [Kocuria rosea]|uniref:TadE/TadG family type IV pilus assembly protein n=1 Tax=Kocuria rosea TaxID=1275 RepID=UPI0020418382|nr:TadE family protein [Kocuria rosea]MCM3688699.1 pilus assembly protein [Kocuria rosea]
MRRLQSERGAVAVEFAFVVPLLLLILLGIIEFGRAYNVQISLTHAARETARTMAIKTVSATEADPWAAAVAAGKAAAPALDGTKMTFTKPAACSVDPTIDVVITYDYGTLTGVVGAMTLRGKAAMQCGG